MPTAQTQHADAGLLALNSTRIAAMRTTHALIIFRSSPPAIMAVPQSATQAVARHAAMLIGGRVAVTKRLELRSGRLRATPALTKGEQHAFWAHPHPEGRARAI